MWLIQATPRLSPSFPPTTMQADGAVLRYPENLGIHVNLTIETALAMLLKSISLAERMPFSWGYIDRPQDGQVFLIYMPNPAVFPNDGIRYQDTESKVVMPAGPGRELELVEIKYGFIPNSGEHVASRLRRRYRLQRGGNPGLCIVHYTRGPSMPVNPSLVSQPVRAYPLRTITEPNMYVAGEKMRQPAYPPGAAPAPGVNYAGGISIPPGANPQALVAQQRSRMEALEGRGAREPTAALAGGRPPPVRVEDDDSGDEGDQISTRALALARYRRNHELMNEVFMYAAFGEKKTPPQPPSYSALFTKSELEEKAAKLVAEVEELKQKEISRPSFEGDVSMESAGEHAEA